MSEALDIAYGCGALKVTTRDGSRSTGPRAHVTGLISGFRELGHRVHPMLAGDRVPARLGRAGESGASMASGSWRGTAADAARLAMNPALGAWTRAGARGADLFYERQATYQVLGAYRPRGVPWVVESNGPFWYEASTERGALTFPRLAKRLELTAYRRADLVVAVSAALKQVLVDAAGLNPHRVLVVPNGVDPARFPAVPRAAATARNDVTVGFVGHVIAWAGLDALVDALAAARAAGAPVRARIIGDGPGMPDLQRYVTARGVGAHVDLVGHLPWSQVPAALGGVDVAFSGQVPMAIGSMYHSPLKLYEYGAAGLPVIATNFPDARSLVEGAGAGWLVAPHDVDSLSAVLLDVAARRAQLPALGAATRAHVLGEHTWVHRAARITAELVDRGLVATPADELAPR